MRLNKEATSEYNKLYREQNRDKVRKINQKYREENREHLREYQHTYNKTPRGRYSQQRKQAIKRNISWEISFEEWWDIWETSGKWSLRGFGAGKYCMSRYKDTGPYHKDNVTIARTEDNKGRCV